MRIKAKRVEGGFLIPFINELKKCDEKEIDIEVEIHPKKEKGFSDEIRSLFKKLPLTCGYADLKEEWHKHLEKKYNG